MKRIINKKTIAKQMVKRAASEDKATEKALNLSPEEKDEVQATVLRELTIVCTNRIRLLEKVLGRKVTISTSMPMGIQIAQDTEDLAALPLYDDERTFTIQVG